MPGIDEDFGSGHSGIAPNDSQGTPWLSGILRALNGQPLREGDTPANPTDWQTGLVVATHVVILPKAGFVVAVEATVGGTIGPALMRTTAPTTATVQVVYDANGVPTLTFAAADAVTEAAVKQLVNGKDLLP